jgi:2-polyprenyl-6-methoxyphenol hydroxylase-like FAD-dependent oxidoreductase
MKFSNAVLQKRNSSILINGCGTVGPLLALALKRQNLEPQLFDSVDEFRDVGGAFNLAPNGLCFVKSLGLLDQVYQGGTPLGVAYIKSLGGKTITKFTGDSINEKYGIYNTGILRSRFHQICMDQVKREGIPVHLGKQLVDIHQNKSKVTAIFKDGSNFTGDVLVGTDGLHSATRQILFGKETPLDLLELRRFWGLRLSIPP